MAKESRAQKQTIERVMHEFKHHELTRGKGGKVRNPKQAIAIALSEAGASNQQSPATNKRRLAETKRRERSGQTAEGRQSREPTRAALYKEAAQKNISGRSRMNKAELQRAVQKAH